MLLETPQLFNPGNNLVDIWNLLILSNYRKLILTPQRRNFKIELTILMKTTKLSNKKMLIETPQLFKPGNTFATLDF